MHSLGPPGYYYTESLKMKHFLIFKESQQFFYTSKVGLGAEDVMTSDVMMGHAKIRCGDVG